MARATTACITCTRTAGSAYCLGYLERTRGKLGVLPSPLWGGEGVGVVVGHAPRATTTTPTPALRADPPQKGRVKIEFAARTNYSSRQDSESRFKISTGGPVAPAAARARPPALAGASRRQSRSAQPRCRRAHRGRRETSRC